MYKPNQSSLYLTAKKLKRSPKKFLQSGDFQPVMISCLTDKCTWNPVNSTWNSIFKPEAIWKAVLLTDNMSQSDSDVFCSLSPFDLFGYVCHLQSSPFAIFDSREVKNLIYFSPQCHSLALPLLSLLFLMLLSLFLSFSEAFSLSQ